MMFHIRFEDQSNQTQEMTTEEPLSMRILLLVYTKYEKTKLENN